jgi:hypothetical protein
MGLKLRQGIAKMLNEPGALIYRNITVVKKTCPLILSLVHMMQKNIH